MYLDTNYYFRIEILFRDKFQFMPKSKNKPHTGIRNGQLFCYNCGTAYDMKLPQPLTMAAAIMKQFEKDHKNCAKIWELPVVDQSKSEEYKAIWWNSGMNGERGGSSECMWQHLWHDLQKLPEKRLPKAKQHPSDADDFRRCYLLLETVPEWKSKLQLFSSEKIS